MSYAFDKTMGALGQKPDDKANIFGDSGAGQQQGPAYGGSGAEGDLSSGGGDVASASKSNAAQGDVSSSAAFRANTGKTAAPSNLAGVRAGIAGKDKALTDEANAYVKNSYGQDSLSDIDKSGLRYSIENPEGVGDEPLPTFKDAPGYDPYVQQEGSPDRGRMSYWQGVASNPIDKVDPFKSSINTVDPNVENLGTEAGVQELLRRNGGAEYSVGDSGFDAALLGQDSGFQQQRQDTMDAYRGLQGRNSDAAVQAISDHGQAAHDTGRARYLESLRNNLMGLNNEYEGAARGRESAAEAAAAARQTELLGGAGGMLDARAKELAAAGGDYAPFYSTEGVDAGQYAHGNFDPEAAGWQDYLGDEDAGRFNRVNGLLGNSTVYGKGSRAGGYSDSDLVSYDTQGMNEALTSGAQSRFAQDAGEKAAATAAAETAKTEAAKAEADKVKTEEDKAAAWEQAKVDHEAADDKGHFNTSDIRDPLGAVAHEDEGAGQVYDHLAQLSPGTQVGNRVVKFLTDKQRHW